MNYKGNFTSELKNFFDKCISIIYPNSDYSIFKADSTMDSNIDNIIQEINYETILAMFPSIPDMNDCEYSQENIYALIDDNGELDFDNEILEIDCHKDPDEDEENRYSIQLYKDSLLYAVEFTIDFNNRKLKWLEHANLLN